MSEKISAKDLQRVMTEHPEDILENIPLEHVQLSIPVDGKGLRVCASVEKGHAIEVPRVVAISVNGRAVEVDVEPVENYEEMVAL